MSVREVTGASMQIRPRRVGALRAVVWALIFGWAVAVVAALVMVIAGVI